MKTKIMLCVVGLTMAMMLFPGNKKKKRAAKIDKSYEMVMIEKPQVRFTTRWVFIIDSSSSIWWKPNRGTVDRIRRAFMDSTKYSSDELYFCIYKFSDKDAEKYMPWTQATINGLNKATKWVLSSSGLYSHGRKSIELALKKKVKNLTLIIITDGGFTSACYDKGFSAIEKTIKRWQSWRVRNKLGKAIICTIGVENKDYYGGGKPTDKICQAFLRKIGRKYGGGYFLVRKKLIKKDNK